MACPEYVTNCLYDTAKRLERAGIPPHRRYELLTNLRYGMILPDQLPHALQTDRTPPRDFGADGLRLAEADDGSLTIVGAQQVKYYDEQTPLSWGGACKFSSAVRLIEASGVHAVSERRYVVQPHSRPTPMMKELWAVDGTTLCPETMEALMEWNGSFGLLGGVRAAEAAKKRVPRSYQLAAAAAFAAFAPPALTPFRVSMPAGVGKSLVLFLSVREAFQNTMNDDAIALLAAPSREIAKQLADDINTWRSDDDCFTATDSCTELVLRTRQSNVIVTTHGMLLEFHKHCSTDKEQDDVWQGAVTDAILIGVDEGHHLDAEHNHIFVATETLCLMAGLDKYLSVSASFARDKEINYELTLAEAERLGVICDSRYYVVAFDNGDTLPATCSMIARGLTMAVVDDHTPPIGSTTIVYWSSVERAKRAAELVAAELGEGGGTKVACVTGEDSATHVDTVLRELSTGVVNVAMVCKKLVEGVDVPSCDCVILGDSTESVKRLTQAFGRANRIAHHKAMVSLIICASLSDLDAAKRGLAAIQDLDPRYKTGERRVEVRLGTSARGGGSSRAPPPIQAAAALLRVEEWVASSMRNDDFVREELRALAEHYPTTKPTDKTRLALSTGGSFLPYKTWCSGFDNVIFTLAADAAVKPKTSWSTTETEFVVKNCAWAVPAAQTTISHRRAMAGTKGLRDSTTAERLTYIATLAAPPKQKGVVAAPLPSCPDTKPFKLGMWWKNVSPNFTCDNPKHRVDLTDADVAAGVDAVKAAEWYEAWLAASIADAAKIKAAASIPLTWKIVKVEKLTKRPNSRAIINYTDGTPFKIGKFVHEYVQKGGPKAGVARLSQIGWLQTLREAKLARLSAAASASKDDVGEEEDGEEEDGEDGEDSGSGEDVGVA